MNTNFFKKQMEMTGVGPITKAPGDLDSIITVISANNNRLSDAISRIKDIGNNLYGIRPENEGIPIPKEADGKIELIKQYITRQEFLLDDCHSLLSSLQSKL